MTDGRDTPGQDGWGVRSRQCITGPALVLIGAAPFLAVDAWFFVAQHGTRDGQFPAFSLLSALVRLAGYQAASLVGGLPLYVDGPLRIAVSALAGAVVAAAVAAVTVSRPWRAAYPTRLLLPAALATPAGLLLLGAVFNTTPIELRYLAFGTPFIALLMARACDRPAWWAQPLLWTLHAVQAAALAGLAVGAQTMQPARNAAQAASPVAAGAIALVPHGNDGVGIVGAFAIEAPPSLPLLVVHPTDDPASLRQRVLPYRRVILALLGQDQDSRATLPVMQQAFAAVGWRRIATGSTIEVYEREQPP